MSKISIEVPTNNNTLFLRCLENVLIGKGVLKRESLPDFRKEPANEILELLVCYLDDRIVGTNFLAHKYAHDVLNSLK